MLRDNWNKGQEHGPLISMQPLSKQMNRVVRVNAGQGSTLEVTFTDATSGTIDLTSRLFRPVFEPLLDPGLFSQVRVDEYGAVGWPNRSRVC